MQHAAISAIEDGAAAIVIVLAILAALGWAFLREMSQNDMDGD